MPDAPDPTDPTTPPRALTLLEFANETMALVKALTGSCDGQPLSVVSAALSVMLEFTVVHECDTHEKLHDFLDGFSAELHRVWVRKQSGDPNWTTTRIDPNAQVN